MVSISWGTSDASVYSMLKDVEVEGPCDDYTAEEAPSATVTREEGAVSIRPFIIELLVESVMVPLVPEIVTTLYQILNLDCILTMMHTPCMHTRLLFLRIIRYGKHRPWSLRISI